MSSKASPRRPGSSLMDAERAQAFAASNLNGRARIATHVACKRAMKPNANQSRQRDCNNALSLIKAW